MYLLIYVRVTLSVRIYFLRLGKSVSERADDGIMIMPQHTTNSTYHRNCAPPSPAGVSTNPL